MIGIVVVNWNSGGQLRNCIDSIQQCKVASPYNIVVVDNASTDGSDLTIKSGSSLKLVRANGNIGFGRACNQGAKQVEGKYLLFLNPDAVLYPETLQKALAYMEDVASDGVGICGVQLLDDSGHVTRSCARFPSPVDLVIHSAGLDRIFKGLGYVMSDWSHAHTQKVDHVIGAFFMVRREVFEVLNGFDERFFLYLEDLDFSYRAHQAGWQSVYLADVQAFHAGGGTSNQIKALRLFYSMRSRLLYAFKHHSWAGATAVMLTTLLIEPLTRSAMMILVYPSWQGLKDTWVAYVMLWRWLPKLPSAGGLR
ncbi:MAG: glycosyltransferase family 2 protein [Burkholderiales bacterium]|jgi:GT2 family glycosyltransferase|nr:glycosyltransferase family 2 protein [Burkholderiales bacterium]